MKKTPTHGHHKVKTYLLRWLVAPNADHNEVLRFDFWQQVPDATESLLAESKQVCHWHPVDVARWTAFKRMCVLNFRGFALPVSSATYHMRIHPD